MKRLTRKKVYIDEIGNRHNYEGNYVYIVEKLGRLEDLEEELECRLEVVFEALKNGIIINEEGYVNSAYENEKFNKEEDSYYDSLNLYKTDNGYFFEDTDSPYGDLECGIIGCNVALKDYQKTWWLKGEKDE